MRSSQHENAVVHAWFNDVEQVDLNEKAPISGAFAEPSDGLEPSTPSLPSRFGGNRSQPVATVLA
jgi:hypothetical protein